MCKKHNCALTCYVLQVVTCVLVFVVYGVINWYPYRAEYPVDKIQILSNQTALQELRSRTNLGRTSDLDLGYWFEVHAAGFQDELHHIKQELYYGQEIHVFYNDVIAQEWSSCVSPEDFDIILHEHKMRRQQPVTHPPGTLDIYLVPPNHTHPHLAEPRMWLSKYRHMWIEIPTLSHPDLLDMLREVVDFFRRPAPAITPPRTPTAAAGEGGTTGEEGGRGGGVWLPDPYSTYRITYGLINLDPHSCVVDWEAENIHNTLIRPFLDSLSVQHHSSGDQVVVQMVSDTQLVQHGEFPEQPQQTTTQQEWPLKAASIQRILNVNNWKLDAFLLSRREKALKFVILVVPEKFCPIVVHDYTGTPVASNSFLIPDWGGVALICPPPRITTNGSKAPVVLYSPNHLVGQYSQFAVQLRKLLGISWSFSVPTNWTKLWHEGEVPLWEMDLFHRELSGRNTRYAMDTLVSFHRLLEQLPQLPLFDSVARHVHKATTFLFTNFNGGHYFPHMRRSQLAASYADAAFYSDSLIAQLYFPQDHKLAVYAPFFFPLTVTMFVAILRAIRTWNTERKEGKKKKEVEEQEKQDKLKKQKDEETNKVD